MKRVLVEFSCDEAIAFFEECAELGIENDLEAKNALLIDFIQRGKAKRVWSTDRTKEEIIADLKKNFGNVVEMQSEPKEQE